MIASFILLYSFNFEIVLYIKLKFSIGFLFFHKTVQTMSLKNIELPKNYVLYNVCEWKYKI